MKKILLTTGIFIFSFSVFAKDIQPEINGEKLQAMSWERITQDISKGKVTYTTATQAYFNLGLVSGLLPGNTVELFRKNKSIGSCQVTQVADHSSTCTFTNAMAGDDAVVRQTVQLEKKQVAFKPLPDEKTFEPINTIVRRSTFTKVTYTATQVSNSNFRHTLGNFPVWLNAQHQTWTASTESTFQVDTVSLTVQDAPLGTENLTTSIDLSTSYWKAPNTRQFRPNDDLQVYLWESSIRYRTSENGLSATAGRIRLWNVPGMTLLDGIQIDVPVGQTWTIGTYGGITPTVVNLGLSKDQTQTGAYIENEIIHSDTFFLRQQSRVGFTNIKSVGHNIDFENILFASARRFMSAYLQVKLNLLGQDKTQFDYANLDTNISPVERWNFRISGRVVKHVPDEYSFIDFYESRRAETSATWKATDWMSITALGGYVQEVSGDKLHHLYTGPEISFYRLLNSKFGATLGHQQEWGWVGGHTSYVRPYVQITNDTRISPQASYTHEIQSLSPYNEWGTGLSLSSTMLRWLDLSGSFYSRFGDGPSGMGGLLSLTGRI